MILPEDRYRFSGKKKNGKPLPVILIVLAVVVLGGLAAFFIISGFPTPGHSVINSADDISVEELWANKHYDRVNEKCEAVLASSPMDYQALVYNGLSYFYRGATQFTLEDKLPLYDMALINLRKALLVDSPYMRGKIKYTIGKCYFQKGNFYTDLSIKYLEESIEDGYTGEDTFEYLGLLYYKLGNFVKSAEFYERAITEKPSDMLYLVLAQTYFRMDKLDRAEEYLLKALGETSDFNIEQKARYLLGDLYTEKEDYAAAEAEYRLILEKNEKAADAHFYLGEIYEKQNNAVKARYEWRRCLEISPNHHGARLKLYN